jgi:hypothetical protein
MTFTMENSKTVGNTDGVCTNSFQDQSMRDPGNEDVFTVYQTLSLKRTMKYTSVQILCLIDLICMCFSRQRSCSLQ